MCGLRRSVCSDNRVSSIGDTDPLLGQRRTPYRARLNGAGLCRIFLVRHEGVRVCPHGGTMGARRAGLPCHRRLRLQSGDEIERAGETVEGHYADDVGDLSIAVAVPGELSDLVVGDGGRRSVNL